MKSIESTDDKSFFFFKFATMEVLQTQVNSIVISLSTILSLTQDKIQISDY